MTDNADLLYTHKEEDFETCDAITARTVTSHGFDATGSHCEVLRINAFDVYMWGSKGNKGQKNPYGPRYHIKFNCAGYITSKDLTTFKGSYLNVKSKVALDFDERIRK
jgi:hypothetical protein